MYRCEVGHQTEPVAYDDGGTYPCHSPFSPHTERVQIADPASCPVATSTFAHTPASSLDGSGVPAPGVEVALVIVNEAEAVGVGEQVELKQARKV